MNTFNISSPIQISSQFSVTGDTFSPSQTHTSVDCTLYFGSQPGGSVVSTASLCDPTSPTFTYTATSGTYYIYEQNGSDNWTSNDLSYTAPTPTPSPTPQITPIYVDIASTSAIAQGVYHIVIFEQVTAIIIIFLLAWSVIDNIIKRT